MTLSAPRLLKLILVPLPSRIVLLNDVDEAAQRQDSGWSGAAESLPVGHEVTGAARTLASRASAWRALRSVDSRTRSSSFSPCAVHPGSPELGRCVVQPQLVDADGVSPAEV